MSSIFLSCIGRLMPNKELERYLTYRIDQMSRISRLVNSLQHMTIPSCVDGARVMCDMYGEILAKSKGKLDMQLVQWLDRMARGEDPIPHLLRKFVCEDVLSMIKDGRPRIPVDPLQIPDYIQQRKLEKTRRVLARHKFESEQRHEKELQDQQARKEREDLELIQRLPEALQKILEKDQEPSKHTTNADKRKYAVRKPEVD